MPRLADHSADSVPLHAVAPSELEAFLAALPEAQAAWARNQGFSAKAGECLALPGADGSIAAALIGRGAPSARARGRFHLGSGASRLPEGTYRLSGDLSAEELSEAALGWLLEGYSFDRYRKQDRQPQARLETPDGVDAARIEAIAAGEFLSRDLINTPAADMGPAELESAARALAKTYGMTAEVITGDDLLSHNFPMIHAVGRASHRAPRLIDLRHGETGPALTLVGKGVCFDTGGLDIKPAASMGSMKKDMGGAATVLGLASMILALKMPVRLRVLIPAVENSIDGNALRPQDILTSRKGLTVEINNTDAEGRLVLADGLAYASEADPGLTISMATLTGAARVALGPDIAPFFTDNDADAAALSQSAARVRDPVWRMPFHPAYETMIEPGIADLDNAPGGGMAGAITAALFLRRFAPERYMHFDIFCSQTSAAPGRPKGGVGQGARALLDALPQMLGL